MREEISISSHIYFKEAVEKDSLNFFLNKMIPLSKKYYRFYKISGFPHRIINKLKNNYPLFFIIIPIESATIFIQRI